MRRDVEIRAESIASPAARRLIAELNAELALEYPPEQRFTTLSPDEVADGAGRFLVAWVEGAPVGCGAVRKLTESDAELKRMYVVPGARGHGLSRAILGALEREAAALGVTRVVLETGTRQHAAMSLYESAGYGRIPAFGPYVVSPASVCFEKLLGDGVP